MFIVNTGKLLGRIFERGYNKTTFSEAVEINRNTLNSLLKNPAKIPYEKIDKMATVLCYDYEDAQSIFFAYKLS